MNRRIGLLAAGGLAVAVVAGGGTALAAAAGPVSGSGVITGCYTNAEVNGSHALVLQDASTSCPKGTSAVTWNQQGPAGATGGQGPAGQTGQTGATGAQGPAGPAGATGAQGPAGPAGASSLDALNGTPCDQGSPEQGALSVLYGSQGSVTITCVPTQLYTLTVSVASQTDGFDAIVSSPAGIDCNPSVASSVCSAQFPIGYTVTLTGQALPPGDVLYGWSGGGCPAEVNITHPYSQTGQPGLVNPTDDTCTITMSADTTVSASFAGVLTVESYASGIVNFVPDPGGPECPSTSPDCKGTGIEAGGVVVDVVPYGTTVQMIDEDGNTVSFTGAACTAGQGATVTATECDFTMIPGDTNTTEEGQQIFSPIVIQG